MYLAFLSMLNIMFDIMLYKINATRELNILINFFTTSINKLQNTFYFFSQETYFILLIESVFVLG